MRQYLQLLEDTLTNGFPEEDRTGTGTLAVFGRQVRYDLREGFPCLTTKKLHLRSIIYELLWFLRGETNVAFLKENKVSIWDEWADKEGNLGPIYGKQWRSWQGVDGKSIDQISQAIKNLKTNPYSRRHLVSAWNVGDLEKMALPPCHILFQFYVQKPTQKEKKPILSCQLYQRSADLFLGVPFNIASYSLLLMIIAQVCDYEVGDFIHTFGNLHLYQNHISQAKEQLKREIRPLPQMKINPNKKEIHTFAFEDFTLENYNPHPHISAKVSV